jgi:hemerythrin
MDDQHGILMDTMNELRLALVSGCGRQQLREGLKQLIEFTRMHFSSEERLLEESGFPGAAGHREAHQRLLVQIEEASQRAIHNEDVQVGPLLSFLRHWYMEHMEGLDRTYEQWLNERGVV